MSLRESPVTRFSSDPPLACRHRDGCRNGSVSSPGDLRRWRAHRRTINFVFNMRRLSDRQLESSTRQVTRLPQKNKFDESVNTTEGGGVQYLLKAECSRDGDRVWRVKPD